MKTHYLKCWKYLNIGLKHNVAIMLLFHSNKFYINSGASLVAIETQYYNNYNYFFLLHITLINKLLTPYNLIK